MPLEGLRSQAGTWDLMCRLQLLGYRVSRFKQRRSYQQSYLKQLKQHFGADTFDVVLPDLAAFERSVTDAISNRIAHNLGSHEQFR